MENLAKVIEMKAQKEARGEYGKGRIWKRGRFFWIQYNDASGRQIRESTRSEVRKVAEKMLTRRFGQIEVGLAPRPRAERTSIHELAEDYFRSYRINQISDIEHQNSDPDIDYIRGKAEKRLDWTEKKWNKHLKPTFGGMRASRLSTDDLNRFIEHRKRQQASNGTINRELALLKRMFNLGTACTPKKVNEVPVFPEKLTEAPPRDGFVEDAEYKRLCDNCTELWLRALIAAAYTFGFRKAELLSMRVRQVDLLDRTIRLRAQTTKNKRPRMVKMTEEVYQLLAKCVSGKEPLDYVFTRADGKPVRDFRVSWSKLTDAAKLSGLLLHDFRRSAVRNMVRRGVPETVAMQISGHVTREIFSRYNITSDNDIADAARLIERGRSIAIGSETGAVNDLYYECHTAAMREEKSSQAVKP
ncbi:MAG TPA: site-specific integrase [Candidatus Dormibacteraeota bacterium]|nr:site-specific integrase [Candidatus Dormibacteraeota bacterium]